MLCTRPPILTTGLRLARSGNYESVPARPDAAGWERLDLLDPILEKDSQRHLHPSLPDSAASEMAVEAVRQGAYNFLYQAVFHRPAADGRTSGNLERRQLKGVENRPGIWPRPKPT